MLFADQTIEQACGRIAGVGFEAIEITGLDGCRHLEDAATRLGGAGLKDLLARHGLALSGFSMAPGELSRYAELLGAAGGGVVVQRSAPAVPITESTQRVRAYVEELKPLADLAGEHNFWLTVANQADSLLNSLDSLKTFVDANTHPRLGIALVPYHLQAVGLSVPEAIRTLGGQLQFFYAWQNAQGLRQLPGYGPTDFRPWLDALVAEGYRGYLNLFMRGYVEPDLLSESLAVSRNYLLYPA